MIGILLGLLLSPWGIAAILFGVVSFFLLPMLSLVTPFKGISRFFLRFAALPLDRAAVVISEHNDALFKQMKFVGLGFEEINIDGEDKIFEDPDSALHHWLGIPFSLADEEHGVLFDPRHSVLGTRKSAYDDNDEGEFVATQEEAKEWGVDYWKPAVFEMPRKHELVDLSAVQELIDGGERSEYPERVKEFYKHSRDPFDDGPSITKFLYPIAGFAVPFFGMWFFSNQFGKPNTTVSFGAALFVMLSLQGIDVREQLQKINWEYVLPTVGIGLFGLCVLGLFIVFLGPAVTLSLLVLYLLGLVVMPVITILAQVSTLLGGALSSLYFKLGFLGFNKPVIEWTPEKYVVREYNDLETVDQRSTSWYNLFGTVVGFTFDPDPSSWGSEVLKHSMLSEEIKAKRGNAETDGGNLEVTDTNVPRKFVRSEQFKRGSYAGFLPKRIRDSRYYLHTAIAMQGFQNSADGKKSQRKLTQAKDEYGSGDDAISDPLVFKATMVMTLFGAIAGLAVFIAPAFL